MKDKRAIFLPLPGGRYPCGVYGGRPTPQRTLLIYGKNGKMSRFKGVKKDKIRGKNRVKIRGLNLRFRGLFSGENFKIMVLYRFKKVKSSTGLKTAKIRRAFIYKGFQRLLFKHYKAVLRGFKGGFKGHLKKWLNLAIFTNFYDPIFRVFYKNMFLEEGKI